MMPSHSPSTLNAPGLGQRMPAWRELVMAEPMPLWLRVAGAVLIALMLLCFYGVVNASAQRAQRQHHSEAVFAEARAYCRGMPNARERDSCAAQRGVALEDDDAP